MDDASKERTRLTAGLDLGDKYSHLCLLDTESGELVEEGRLCTTDLLVMCATYGWSCDDRKTRPWRPITRMRTA